MKEVTKQDFYKQIGSLNVTTTVEGDYPYTTIFRNRINRKQIGQIKSGRTDTENRYYLPKEIK